MDETLYNCLSQWIEDQPDRQGQSSPYPCQISLMGHRSSVGRGRERERERIINRAIHKSHTNCGHPHFIFHTFDTNCYRKKNLMNDTVKLVAYTNSPTLNIHLIQQRKPTMTHKPHTRPHHHTQRTHFKTPNNTQIERGCQR